MKIAIIGHVEHVTLGRVDAVPAPGDVIHLRDPRFAAAGGGGIAFAQFCKSDAEVHFFTAIGNDGGGRRVREAIDRAPGRVHVHAAVRGEPHPRVVVMIDAQGRRTIVVTGAPLQARASDDLPWSVFASCDAAYFTGADPEVLKRARAAKKLVATARRAPVLRDAHVAPDIVIGSLTDPRENAPLASYDAKPGALVLTDGPRRIHVIRAEATTYVDAPRSLDQVVGDYGAGDTFAAAMTYFFARGMQVEQACAAAGPFGAAILRGLDPTETQRELPTDSQ
jgi:ribokinase